MYKAPSGLNVYSFEYKDESFGKGLHQGVMAHEVEHIDGAVINFRGTKWVNYNKIDVEFKQI